MGETVAGCFLVERGVAEGGFGVVYQARHLELERAVALKVLKPPAASGPVADAFQHSFEAEARTMARLQHPNIVSVYDFGVAIRPSGAPIHWIALQWLEGRTLDAMLLERRLGSMPPLEPAAALALLRPVMEGITFAHQSGVVHRDLKPANIFLHEQAGRQVPKVLDFGIARMMAPDKEAAGSGTSATTRGFRVFSPDYAAPEQVSHGRTGPWTDVHALGLLLTELLTGEPPYGTASSESDLEGRFERVLSLQRPTPGSKGVGVGSWERVLVKALARRGADRFPDADALLEALESAPLGMPLTDPCLTHRHTSSVANGSTASWRQLFERRPTVADSMLSVAGEPGIGKSSLVEKFLASVAPAGAARLARGRCSERLAGAEAYLPVLEMLDSLLQATDGKTVERALRKVAPTWFVQVVPASQGSTDDADLYESARGASQERLKREMATLLRELCRSRPLVVFFDDVHWADVSTIDLLAYLGHQLANVRLLLIVTYRPTELLLTEQSFLQVKRDLQARGVCHELMLEFLPPAAVGQYLDLEFPGHRFPDALVELVHTKSEGSPLFMTDLVGYLRVREVIAHDTDGAWVFRGALSEVGRDLPESVRGMVERKIAQLEESDRALLAVASVQGYEFDSAVLANVLSRPVEQLEDRLDTLERVHAFVRTTGETRLPDGTATLRYRFVHVLYQNAFFGDLRLTKRTTLSAAVAESLQRFYGDRDGEVAGELAVLFEAARDTGRAAGYCLAAAHKASRLFAAHEAEALARRGLALLEASNDAEKRQQLELPLVVCLGNAFIATRGYQAVEVEQTYSRALTLSRQAGDMAHRTAAIYGLTACNLVRANYRQSLSLAQELLAAAERNGSPATVVGHRMVGWPLLMMGDLEPALLHFQAAGAQYDQRVHRPLAYDHGNEPGVSAQVMLAITLWLLGSPDQAERAATQALGLLNEISHANSRAFGYKIAAMHAQLRGDTTRTRELARIVLALADEQDLPLWRGWGSILHGWAVSVSERKQEGVVEIQRGLESVRGRGATLWYTYNLSLLVDALRSVGRIEETAEVLDRALATVVQNDERFWECEILRQRAEILVVQGATSEAEQVFTRSIAVAEKQRSRTLGLRATISLARLWLFDGRRERAKSALSNAYARFTEGFETPDLQLCRSLLDQLSGRPAG